MLEDEFVDTECVDTDSKEPFNEEYTESNKSKEKEKLWNKCVFRCEREITLRKRTNTKHHQDFFL